jgi:FAD/FMN-containing dehydrogenase
MIEVAQPDQLPALLRARASDAPPLVPRGLGTRTPPLPEEVEQLRLDRLAGIEELDREDMILTALAGTAVEVAARAAAEAGLLLCPLIPIGTGGTLGGLHASGKESPAAPTEGRVRDAVLGVEGVTGSGAPLRSGGRVVKNVTGYDLTRFLSGSRGMLAVITRMHWRLRRLPERWIEVTARRAALECEALLSDVRNAPEPTAVRLDLEEGVVTVRVLVEGTEGAAEDRARRIAAAIDGEGSSTPIEPEALISWLDLGPGSERIETTRQWARELARLGADRAERASVFPFIGVGRVRGRPEPAPLSRPSSEFLEPIARVWDPAGRLWDGGPR